MTGFCPTLEQTDVTETFLLFKVVLKNSVLSEVFPIQQALSASPWILCDLPGVGMFWPTADPSTRSAEQPGTSEAL